MEMLFSETHSFWGTVSSHGNHCPCLETACCLWWGANTHTSQGSWSNTSLRFLPHGPMKRIP
uniref:Uncharacterized protein n=1 Tax=Mandrillus leucophaeus TaxID=9568 RepID=A0A2K5XE73_MANLE